MARTKVTAIFPVTLAPPGKNGTMPSRLLRKMKKKAVPVAIMICSFAVMLAINIFSLNISTIAIMLAAAVVSLSLFAVKEMTKEEAKEEDEDIDDELDYENIDSLVDEDFVEHNQFLEDEADLDEKLLESLKDSKDYEMVSELGLRSMQKAIYSTGAKIAKGVVSGVKKFGSAIVDGFKWVGSKVVSGVKTAVTNTAE